MGFKRWVVIALVAGCTSEPATLHLDVGAGTIVFLRASDHAFGTLAATVNGVDCGTPTVIAGDPGKQFDHAPTDSSATFHVPAVDDTASVVVTEAGERFAMDVTMLAAPRAANVTTALDQPVHPGDWIEVTSGVATDLVTGGITGVLGGANCFNVSSVGASSSMRVQVPQDLASQWICGSPPAAGTQTMMTLTIGVSPWAEVATCDGPSLTCTRAALPLLADIVPVTIQM